MDIGAVRALMSAARLPERYEPLLLSFVAADETQAKGQLVAIGDDCGTTLYCDLADGHILSLDDSGRLPARFVNSGITQLARCLAEYETAQERKREPSQELDDVAVAGTLRSRLARVDAVALADPEHWWSVIVEQVADGLL